MAFGLALDALELVDFVGEGIGDRALDDLGGLAHDGGRVGGEGGARRRNRRERWLVGGGLGGVIGVAIDK